VIAPKKMLKMREVNSDKEDFAPGKCFERVLPETNAAIKPEKTRKLLFCSG